MRGCVEALLCFNNVCICSVKGAPVWNRKPSGPSKLGVSLQREKRSPSSGGSEDTTSRCIQKCQVCDVGAWTLPSVFLLQLYILYAHWTETFLLVWEFLEYHKLFRATRIWRNTPLFQIFNPIGGKPTLPAFTYHINVLIPDEILKLVRVILLLQRSRARISFQIQVQYILQLQFIIS